MINQKADFNKRKQKAVEYYEIFLTQAPLKSGLYTDSGHRFRFNQIKRTDFWFYPLKSLDVFFDYVFFNHDTYEVSKSDSLLAELYFRLDID